MVEYKRANRQYVAMTEEEVWRFLESHKKIFLAFTREDGFPHVAPVWFCVVDKKIYIRGASYKVKIALARTGKSCLVIDEGEKYRELRGVIIWGRSRVVGDGEKELISRVDAVRTERYADLQWRPGEMPQGWVEERKKEKNVYVEVVPELVSSWDNRKV